MKELIDLFNSIERQLERIAVALESGMSTRSAPNYQASLGEVIVLCVVPQRIPTARRFTLAVALARMNQGKTNTKG